MDNSYLETYVFTASENSKYVYGIQKNFQGKDFLEFLKEKMKKNPMQTWEYSNPKATKDSPADIRSLRILPPDFSDDIIYDSYLEKDLEKFKYIHFLADRGSNGSNFRVEQENGNIIGYSASDKLYREFNVFLAYPNSEEAFQAILFVENRGIYGVKTELQKYFETLLESVGTNLKVNLKIYEDTNVVARYIDAQQVNQISFYKKIQGERGENRLISYGEEMIAYRNITHLSNQMRQNFKNLFRMHRKGQPIEELGIQNVDNFAPDVCKIQVENRNGKKKIYTAGGSYGIMKLDCPEEAIRADGSSNGRVILDFMIEEMSDNHCP